MIYNKKETKLMENFLKLKRLYKLHQWALAFSISTLITIITGLLGWSPFIISGIFCVIACFLNIITAFIDKKEIKENDE